MGTCWKTHLRAADDVALCDLKPRRKLASRIKDVTCQKCIRRTWARVG